MSIKSFVPNAITLLNLFSGLLAIVLIINQEFYGAFFAVCAGVGFDFFDGFAARLLKVSSDLGTQLDSLADMVTSGVVPGLAMFYLLLDTTGLSLEMYANPTVYNASMLVPLIGFSITLGSCYRLAKFNIDERQSDSFIGLPTPANCLMIVSLPILLEQDRIAFISELLRSTWFLVTFSIVSAILLNAKIYLFSLKIKSKDWSHYFLPIIFVLVTLVALVLFQLYAVPFLILLYVALSLIVPTKKVV